MGSQLHLPHSSLRFRFPSLYCRRVDSLPTNSPLFSTLELKSTETTVFRPLSVVRSRFSESDITPQIALAKSQDKSKPRKRAANGIFLIILINLGIFMAEHCFEVRGIKSMYMYGEFPAWYQFVTAIFCHANLNRLSSDLFLLYIFGKIVEEEKGTFGLWLSYLFTGVGANLVSWLVIRLNTPSLGSLGAVFGLFVISLLATMSWDWRKFLEVLILGQFVVKRVFEASWFTGGYLDTLIPPELVRLIMSIIPITQLSGALVGVLLVSLLRISPSEPDKKVDHLKNPL